MGKSAADLTFTVRKEALPAFRAGYLAAIVGMEPRWSLEHGISIDRLVGIILISAQVTTHFMIKELRGTHTGINNLLIDSYALLFYVSKNLPPIFLMTGVRTLDIPGRAEENHFLAANLRALGHRSVEMHEMKGCDHAAMDAFPDGVLHWMMRTALLLSRVKNFKTTNQ